MVDTPETRAAVETQNAEWRSDILRNYDLPALHEFLSSIIEKRPIVDNIDLRKAPIAPKWRLIENSLTCGGWTFNSASPVSSEFEMVWTIDDVPDPKNGGGVWKLMTLHCRRDGKAKFFLIDKKYSVEEYITLVP